MTIGIVGPCAAGKSTLVNKLRDLGFNAKHIAQEHSYVQDMWFRLTNPDVLIFLDVSYATTLNRRHLNWTEEEFKKQVLRLEHARKNADCYLPTDSLSPSEVLAKVLLFLIPS